MSDYAIQILTKERQKLKDAMKRLTHEFCTVPSYEQWKNGIEAMSIEEYDKKALDLTEKLDSVEHALLTLTMMVSRKW